MEINCIEWRDLDVKIDFWAFSFYLTSIYFYWLNQYKLYHGILKGEVSLEC
jgi:hypothetical protein